MFRERFDIDTSRLQNSAENRTSAFSCWCEYNPVIIIATADGGLNAVFPC